MIIRCASQSLYTTLHPDQKGGGGKPDRERENTGNPDANAHNLVVANNVVSYPRCMLYDCAQGKRTRAAGKK